VALTLTSIFCRCCCQKKAVKRPKRGIGIVEKQQKRVEEKEKITKFQPVDVSTGELPFISETRNL